jgi:hypothetical protein
MSIQFCLLEKKTKWNLNETNTIIACTANGHFLLKPREKKKISTKKPIARKKRNISKFNKNTSKE